LTVIDKDLTDILLKGRTQQFQAQKFFFLISEEELPEQI